MKVLLKDWNNGDPLKLAESQGFEFNVIGFHKQHVKQGMIDFTLEIPVIEVESLEALVEQCTSIQIFRLPVVLEDFRDVLFEVHLTRFSRRFTQA